MRRVAAVITAVALTPTQPAQALQVDVAKVEGAGTINPGLDVLTTPQSISFTGSALVVGTDGVPVVYECAWAGTGLQDSLAAGSGTVAGACGPMAYANCIWTREGTDVQLVCVAADRASTLHGRFVFEPTTSLPITRYTLLGIAVVAGAA